MSQTRDQKRFTISEVAADLHELMIPQRTMRPSIGRVSEQLDPRFAAGRHTTAPVSERESTATVSGCCILFCLIARVLATLSHGTESGRLIGRSSRSVAEEGVNCRQKAAVGSR